eukprot:1158399-Pelagomonas_calceolata.AAC.1
MQSGAQHAVYVKCSAHDMQGARHAVWGTTCNGRHMRFADRCRDVPFTDGPGLIEAATDGGMLELEHEGTWSYWEQLLGASVGLQSMKAAGEADGAWRESSIGAAGNANGDHKE